MYILDNAVWLACSTQLVVDRGFDPRSGQKKDYKTGICCWARIIME